MPPSESDLMALKARRKAETESTGVVEMSDQAPNFSEN